MTTGQEGLLKKKKKKWRRLIVNLGKSERKSSEKKIFSNQVDSIRRVQTEWSQSSAAIGSRNEQKPEAWSSEDRVAWQAAD